MRTAQSLSCCRLAKASIASDSDWPSPQSVRESGRNRTGRLVAEWEVCGTDTVGSHRSSGLLLVGRGPGRRRHAAGNPWAARVHAKNHNRSSGRGRLPQAVYILRLPPVNSFPGEWPFWPARLGEVRDILGRSSGYHPSAVDARFGRGARRSFRGAAPLTGALGAGCSGVVAPSPAGAPVPAVHSGSWSRGHPVIGGRSAWWGWDSEARPIRSAGRSMAWTR